MIEREHYIPEAVLGMVRISHYPAEHCVEHRFAPCDNKFAERARIPLGKKRLLYVYPIQSSSK